MTLGYALGSRWQTEEQQSADHFEFSPTVAKKKRSPTSLDVRLAEDEYDGWAAVLTGGVATPAIAPKRSVGASVAAVAMAH